MPRGDGTGPQGLGPKTGKGVGPCGNMPRQPVEKPEIQPNSKRQNLGQRQGLGRRQNQSNPER